MELHQIYFEKAKSDPKSLTGLMQLNEVLFKSNENELMALLNDIPDSVTKERAKDAEE